MSIGAVIVLSMGHVIAVAIRVMGQQGLTPQDRVLIGRYMLLGLAVLLMACGMIAAGNLRGGAAKASESPQAQLQNSETCQAVLASREILYKYSGSTDYTGVPPCSSTLSR